MINYELQYLKRDQDQFPKFKIYFKKTRLDSFITSYVLHFFSYINISYRPPSILPLFYNSTPSLTNFPLEKKVMVRLINLFSRLNLPRL